MHVDPIDRLFLHFYDPHFFEERKKSIIDRNGRSAAATEARLATRIAVMAAREVLIPAASFVEVLDCRTALWELADLFEIGKIRLVGSGSTLTGYAGEKLLQYDPAGSRYELYESVMNEPQESPPFLSRRNSATEDVRQAWWGVDLSHLLRGTEIQQAAVEPVWHHVPDYLGARAFTPEYAMGALEELVRLSGPSKVVISSRVAGQINAAYFDSFACEYQCGTFRNLLYLESEQAPPHDTWLDYRSVVSGLQRE